MVSRIEYDDFGSIKKESAPCEEGRVPVTVWYNYDSHHRISDIQHDDGSREVMHYDGRTTSISFHSSDNVLQSESKTLNIMGWVVKSTDANGVSVLYDYYPDGKIQYSQIEGSDETKTMMAYDGIGNRTLLVDPNYGTTHSFYNAFNEMICQISPNADTTRYEYDQLGNMIRRIETSKKNHLSMTTEWQYGNEEGKAGLLLKIKSDNQTIDYEYDNLLRLKTVSELCLGEAYKTSYTYDLASRVSDIIYPSHYSIHYCYSSEGMLRSITDNVCNELWKTKETNAMGLPTRFITGDGYISDFQYHPSTNRLKAIHTLHGGEKVQDYLYEYDDFTNMTVRADLLRNITEHFTYDPLNRLTGVSDNQGESLFHYDDLGRMTSKTRWGQTVFSDAEYGESLPYAIKSAVSTHGTFPQERMDLDYTTFGKVARIQEGTNRITYQYGCDHQRIHVKEEIEGQIREKTYVNQCEFITKPNEAPIIRTFLSGPSGIFAVAESVDNNITLHYVHKDHLGSWTLVTDSNGKIEQENHFDAWGYCEHSDDLIFDRGFCGHEHIKGMNLINMNGRIYDPVTSSMLSPDNFVQMPDFTQNFNRYAYCLNNPLTYTDPSGNTIVETSLLIYFIFFTDMGYEFQKHVSPIAVHIDVHLGKHQKGVGVDVSIGFEKKFPLAYRFNLGVTYYWGYYDDSYKGWEFRVGGEWTAYGVVGYSGTTFYTKGRQQTTNAIIIGNYIGSATYENDYMFNLGENTRMLLPAGETDN